MGPQPEQAGAVPDLMPDRVEAEPHPEPDPEFQRGVASWYGPHFHGRRTANGEVFNLGAGDPLSLEDTAKLLIEIYGKGTYELIPFPAERQVIDIGNYYGNYHKIQSQLGWQPKTSFRAGVEHTLAFYGRYSMHYWQDVHAA